MPGVCPRCRHQVYFAEESIVLGKTFHKMCVKCFNCNKMLDSGSVTDHGDEIYCKSCYGRLFGPKGYGYGIGAGVLSMDDGTRYENGPPRCNVPSTDLAYLAPLKRSTENLYNNNDCQSRHETYSQCSDHFSSSNNNNSVTPPVPASRPKWGGGAYCNRCNQPVFMAERVMAAGGSYHKACFTCVLCNKRLDSNSIREREKNIYCNPCYMKNFGPKGYWGWSSAKVS